MATFYASRSRNLWSDREPLALNEEIAVILTCFNRREKTLACLHAIFGQNLYTGYRIKVFITDDGCTDDTAVALSELFPTVQILTGNGNLFWNGGMRLAFEEALKGNYDFYLWLNDDTLLTHDALATMLRTYNEVLAATGTEPVVVGTTRSPDDGRPTYGGVERLSPLRRTRFSLVKPAAYPLECETMNGNCVLIPRAVALKIGNLESGFVHGMGDFDYGLRARTAGFKIWIMPGFAGVCSKNSLAGSFYDSSLSLTERWMRMRYPKGLPPREWCLFCKRHAGLFWVIFFFWPFLRVFFKRKI